jgi:hypothetical protein
MQPIIDRNPLLQLLPPRAISKLRAPAKRLAISAAVFVAWGCTKGTVEVVERVASPDSSREAVVVETNAGAMTSFGYFVYVVPRGRRPSSEWLVGQLYAAYRNDSAAGVNVRWSGPNELHLEYLGAKAVTLVSPTRSSGLLVRLDSGKVDMNAPGGGMHHVRHD